jgi:hypothetical protein
MAADGRPGDLMRPVSTTLGRASGNYEPGCLVVFCSQVNNGVPSILTNRSTSGLCNSLRELKRTVARQLYRLLERTATN